MSVVYTSGVDGFLLVGVGRPFSPPYLSVALPGWKSPDPEPEPEMKMSSSSKMTLLVFGLLAAGVEDGGYGNDVGDGDGDGGGEGEGEEEAIPAARMWFTRLLCLLSWSFRLMAEAWSSRSIKSSIETSFLGSSTEFDKIMLEVEIMLQWTRWEGR